MKFGIIVTFLFLMYETPSYFVKGKTLNGEKSDCTIFYNFINGDSKDYADSCCEDNGIECDEEKYIISFDNSFDIKIPNFASFPYLSRIDGLYIRESGLKEIPNSILNLKSLTSMEVGNNSIEVIPPAIQNLSKLTHLSLMGNAIKELPNEMFNLKNLEVLDISENKIEIIPPAIKNLSNLIGLYLEDNDIKELPKEVFSLTNVERFALAGNKNLKTNVTNPNNSSIKYCLFSDIEILCYEHNSCETIILNDEELDNLEAEKKYNKCPKEEIGEGINSNESSSINQNDSKSDSKQSDKKLNSPVIKGGIIIGCGVLILIGVLVAFMFIKKNRSKQNNNSDSISNDKFQSGNNIELLLNDKQVVNNDNNAEINNTIIISNNVDGVDNNNSNDNNDIDSNNTINEDNNNCNNSIHNIKSSVNPNDIVNSNGCNTFPGRIVLINSPQVPGIIDMNNGPIINNNNSGSISTQNIPPSYDQINMNMNANNSNGTIIYYTTFNELDEPLPEYSEN